MKKFLALVMVGVMALGTVAMASPSPSPVAATVSCAPAAPAAPVQSYAEKVAATTAAAAAAEGKTVTEYVNNVVESAPGVEAPVVMGIPSGAYINGVKTNYSVKMDKASADVVKAGSAFGKVLNAFNVKNCPAGEVQIRIWSKSFVAGQKVVVYQLINGQWVKLVSSVRAENVDVILQGSGPIVVVETN